MALNREKIVAGAQKFIQRGQLDKAIKEFQRILEEDPKDVRTLLKIGDLYSKKGERDNATQTYLKVAEFYSDQGFFLKAVAVYKQILKVDPNLIQVNVKLADLYNQLGLASDALAQYQSVALHFEKAGDIPKTIGVLRKMIELEPNNVGSRIKLAEVYAKQQMPADAVGELSKAAALLKQNGRTDDYARVTERILHLQPDDAKLSQELAEFYLEHNDVKRALAKLQVCFKTNPRDLRTLEMLAQSFTALGQTHKTVSVYRELAKIYSEGNDDTKRRQYLRKILELAPDDEEAKEVELRATPGAAVAAGAAPAPVLKGPPAKSSEAMQKLLTETDVYMKYGLRDKALEHLKKIFAIQPENLDAHGKVRDIYMQNGDLDGAKKSLLTMGRIAIARDLPDKAREWLHEAARMEGGSPEATALLSTLPEEVSEEIAEDDLIEDLDEVTPEDASVELAAPEEAVSAPEDFELEPPHEPLPAHDEDDGIDLAIDEHEVELHSEPVALDATTSAGEEIEDDLFAPTPGGASLAPDEEDEGIDLELPDGDELAALTTAPPEPELDETAPLAAAEDDFDFGPSSPTAAKAAPLAPVADRVTKPAKSVAPSKAFELDDLDLAPPGTSHELDLDLGPAPPLGAAEAPLFDHRPLDFGADEVGESTPEPALQSETAAASPTLDDSFDAPMTVPGNRSQPIEEEVTSPVLAAPLAPTVEVDVTDELGEAEFFEQQGLTDDAIDGYRSVLTKAPHTQRARERLEALTGEKWPEPAAGAPAKPAPKPQTPGPASAATTASVAKLDLKANKPATVTEKAVAKVVVAPEAEAAAVAKPAPSKPAEPATPAERKASATAAKMSEAAEPKPAETKAPKPAPAATKPVPAGATKGGGVTKQLISEDALGNFDNFDLAGELADDFNDAAQEAAEIERIEDEQFSADEIFSEFKKGVAATVTDDDYATHYDLGIAYKEMGLVDDAVREFEVAAKGSAKEVDALVMVGICLVESNDAAGALAAFKRAGQSDHITPKQALAVRYELANAMDKSGDLAGAQALFAKVAATETTYRDAAARAANAAPAPPPEPETTGQPPKKGKISYV